MLNLRILYLKYVLQIEICVCVQDWYVEKKTTSIVGGLVTSVF